MHAGMALGQEGYFLQLDAGLLEDFKTVVDVDCFGALRMANLKVFLSMQTW